MSNVVLQFFLPVSLSQRFTVYVTSRTTALQANMQSC